MSEYDFSMAISEEGRGPQEFHPDNARDGVKPQREAFDYASFCSILLWDVTRAGIGAVATRTGCMGRDAPFEVRRWRPLVCIRGTYTQLRPWWPAVTACKRSSATRLPR